MTANLTAFLWPRRVVKKDMISKNKPRKYETKDLSTNFTGKEASDETIESCFEGERWETTVVFLVGDA